MLLVMSTQGVFQPLPVPTEGEPISSSNNHNLWDATWKHLGVFLPKLKDELFPPQPSEAEKSNIGGK